MAKPKKHQQVLDYGGMDVSALGKECYRRKLVGISRLNKAKLQNRLETDDKSKRSQMTLIIPRKLHVAAEVKPGEGGEGMGDPSPEPGERGKIRLTGVLESGHCMSTTVTGDTQDTASRTVRVKPDQGGEAERGAAAGMEERGELCLSIPVKDDRQGEGGRCLSTPVKSERQGVRRSKRAKVDTNNIDDEEAKEVEHATDDTSKGKPGVMELEGARETREHRNSEEEEGRVKGGGNDFNAV